MHTDANRLNQLSEAVLHCAFTALNTLGTGFLEKMRMRWRTGHARGVSPLRSNAVSQSLMTARQSVSISRTLPVQETLLIELKATKAPDEVHYAQCIDYLQATRLRL